MWNWISEAGLIVEFVGFGLLAYDLWDTTQKAARDHTEVAAKDETFSAISFDDATGGDILGGKLEALLNLYKLREKEWTHRLATVLRGIFVTAVGAALQVIGGFGQALAAHCG